METKITFKALDYDGKIVHKTIPIKHTFKVKPEETFMGYTFSPQSIESQVIEYLDSMDKKELMQKYRFSVILDYYPQKKKKSKKEEFVTFMNFLSEIITIDRSIEAVISESKDILFGKGKSNIQKAKEVLAMTSIAYKAAEGTLGMVIKILDPSKRSNRKAIPVNKNE